MPPKVTKAAAKSLAAKYASSDEEEPESSDDVTVVKKAAKKSTAKSKTPANPKLPNAEAKGLGGKEGPEFTGKLQRRGKGTTAEGEAGAGSQSEKDDPDSPGQSIALKSKPSSSGYISKATARRAKSSKKTNADAMVIDDTIQDKFRSSSSPKSDDDDDDDNLALALNKKRENRGQDVATDLERRYSELQLKYTKLQTLAEKEAMINLNDLLRNLEDREAAKDKHIEALEEKLTDMQGLADKLYKLKSENRNKEAELQHVKAAFEEKNAEIVRLTTDGDIIYAKLEAARSVVKQKGGGKDYREELYTDLSGLIIRDTREDAEGNIIYDCLQTAKNGTLHFKMELSNPANTKYDENEFTYTPLIDEQRDAPLIDVLPEYLQEEITFAREGASKFYKRLVIALEANPK